MEKKNKNFNYIFFFLWLAFTSSFLLSSISHVGSFKSIFFIHGFSQIFLEIILLSIILFTFEKIFGKKGLYFCSSMLLIFLIMRYIDFMMLILMDNSIFYAINIIFGNGFSFILTNLEAANINNKMLIFILSAIVALPFISIFLFSFLNKISTKKPITFTVKRHLSYLAAISLIILFFDFLIFLKLDDSTYFNYRKRLPYTFSFFNKSKSTSEKLPFILPEKKYTEKEFDEKLNKKIKTSVHNNNIFLFVIESFRKDAILDEIAPTLSNFKKENLSFQYSFSNANTTHSSWFSLFYSLYPLNWPYYHASFSKGSTNLRIMNKIGYDIHVSSSADLAYYNMDTTLFGRNLSILKSHVFFKDSKAWVRDAKAFKNLKKIAEGKRKNNLFITFLDSTHSEYDCPDNYNIKFKPITESINYLKLCYRPSNIETIKNRYKNAVNYLDDLFANFFTFLKKENLYDDAIIIITGDHGEEFFEEGSFFHGTHLNKYQINIPTIYKIPLSMQNKHKNPNREKITSLVDLFPTIFNLIKTNHFPSKYFDGKSIFSNEKKNNISCISVSNNGPLKPTKIAVFKDQKKYVIKKSDAKPNDYIVEEKLDIIQDKY